MTTCRRRRVLTWHVHGSYLYYLAQAPVDLYVLSTPDRGPGYMGRHGHFPWGENVFDMPVSEVRDHAFDCILFQSHQHYLRDQYQILSPAQQQLPRVYLEHDPPRQHPVDTKHPVDDPDVLVVHVTHFNRLMWDNGRSPTHVIAHGVTVPADVRYTGGKPRGIVVVNHLARRGRRLGADIYADVRQHVALDLVGMGADESPGGLGEVRHDALAAFIAEYRFFFNPIRYTSLGLAVCEAMMLGVPIVGLATTELAVTIENGVSGFVYTDPARLVESMQMLLADPASARRIGEGAQAVARERFGIERFARDWAQTFDWVAGRREGVPIREVSRH